MDLCVIPARGGSKRIPRKNIRDFCGKPIIAWSIEAAHSSGCFDRVVVSTDDDEIANVAKRWGAEIPFRRSVELSDDFAGTIPVIVHAVEWCINQGLNLDSVCCLYATAPFVDSGDIAKGRELLNTALPDRFVFSATTYSSPIQRALRLDPLTGQAHMWHPDQFFRRSQDLEPAYHDAGQFYWGRAHAWLQVSNLFEGSVPLLLPRWRVQDIDTRDDWTQAELMRRAQSIQFID
ncbi:pseudaminic acid cytidylyltransferase [Synechococcus sp. HK01-R]|uniref:pseudaminic acid cytidylyltransferase n=1 Tax=Synechococcus sp. HK01-R TaxID=2751171 RepID=UPI0016292A32|nr:pseudaminic acid cytidylyltransferase [Synechococcus sp. HK01-R]QNG28270.1 pseudaminic acid cytidylyltransferase [Synechococcus sp. HK01-R]